MWVFWLDQYPECRIWIDGKACLRTRWKTRSCEKYVISRWRQMPPFVHGKTMFSPLYWLWLFFWDPSSRWRSRQFFKTQTTLNWKSSGGLSFLWECLWTWINGVDQSTRSHCEKRWMVGSKVYGITPTRTTTHPWRKWTFVSTWAMSMQLSIMMF